MISKLTPERFKQAREHFHVLLELPPGDRRARLDELKYEDPDLASVVSELLDHASQLDEESELPQQGPWASHGMPVGAIIDGRYRILEQIGEGGMAEVYLAERTDDIAHKVALKLMRAGNRAMFRRFVRERQILARLNHPHIAHLTDGGLTDDGVPWFAMEHVEGERITDWCDRERLDLKARTHLFIRVCRAVQFAHRNLVLHRDIKPSNILVDGGSAPRLLDFGIAKLIDATDPEQTQTLAMTPAYAAPEQLRGEPVTTASDIYQLGLVLRELLTGVSTHELRRKPRRTADGTRTLPRMDQTFAQCPIEAANRIAQARNSQPLRLKHALRGDLDRIVQKACADEPRERYDTAQALADDLERWRKGLPVNAHRGSVAYRTGKLLRRHAVAASVVVLCAAGLVASTIYSWQRAEAERLERQRSETVLDFMRNVFQQGNPVKSGGQELSPAELLQRAAEELKRTDSIDDRTQATLLTEISIVFNTLGLPGQAMPYAQQALDLLEARRERHVNAYFEAFSELITAKRDLHLNDEVLTLIDQVLPLADSRSYQSRPWRPLLIAARGYAFVQVGDYESAQRDLKDALSTLEELGIHSGRDYAIVLGYMGLLAAQSEDHARAIELYRKTIAVYEEIEDGRINILAARYSMAQQYYALGLLREALDEYEQLLIEVVDLISADDTRVSMIRTSQALAYARMGDFERASQAISQIPHNHLDSHGLLALQWPLTELTRARLLLGQLKFAEALSETQSLLSTGSLRPTVEGTRLESRLQRSYWVQAEALLQMGDCKQAIPMLEELLATSNLGSRIAADTYDSLGRCWLILGAVESAGIHFTSALTLLRSEKTHNSPNMLRIEIHALWAKILSTRDPDILNEIEIRRARLVEKLGSEDHPVVWQLDLLVGDIQRELLYSDPSPERRERAATALIAFGGMGELPRFVGLVSLI